MKTSNQFLIAIAILATTGALQAQTQSSSPQSLLEAMAQEEAMLRPRATEATRFHPSPGSESAVNGFISSSPEMRRLAIELFNNSGFMRSEFAQRLDLKLIPLSQTGRVAVYAPDRQSVFSLRVNNGYPQYFIMSNRLTSFERGPDNDYRAVIQMQEFDHTQEHGLMRQRREYRALRLILSFSRAGYTAELISGYPLSPTLKGNFDKSPIVPLAEISYPDKNAPVVRKDQRIVAEQSADLKLTNDARIDRALGERNDAGKLEIRARDAVRRVEKR